VGVPPEAVGIVYGVDRILDMTRTTLNVCGDLTAAVYVARAETDWTPSLVTDDVPVRRAA
jgi:DAACS family dicarboxylate/amino acid:cation (Na+ or H+) symporter